MSPTGSSGLAADRPFAPEPYEYMLAVVEKGFRVSEHDPLIRQFDEALDELEDTCLESRGRLANMGARGREILLDEGIEETLLELFTDWRLRVSDAAQNGGVQRCSEVLSAYLVERTRSGDSASVSIPPRGPGSVITPR